jgi:hypothetical protein
MRSQQGAPTAAAAAAAVVAGAAEGLPYKAQEGPSWAAPVWAPVSADPSSTLLLLRCARHRGAPPGACHCMPPPRLAGGAPPVQAAAPGSSEQTCGAAAAPHHPTAWPSVCGARPRGCSGREPSARQLLHAATPACRWPRAWQSALPPPPPARRGARPHAHLEAAVRAESWGLHPQIVRSPAISRPLLIQAADCVVVGRRGRRRALAALVVTPRVRFRVPARLVVLKGRVESGCRGAGGSRPTAGRKGLHPGRYRTILKPACNITARQGGGAGELEGGAHREPSMRAMSSQP